MLGDFARVIFIFVFFETDLFIRTHYGPILQAHYPEREGGSCAISSDSVLRKQRLIL